MTSRGWTIILIAFALAALSLGVLRGAAPGSPVALLAASASAPPAPLHFTVQDLGTLGGEVSFGNHLNDLYQAVGSSLTADGLEHPYIFSAGKMTGLSAPSE